MSDEKPLPIVVGQPEVVQTIWRPVDYLCVGFFMLCLVFWLFLGPFVSTLLSSALEEARDPMHHGDAFFAVGILAFFCAVGSVPFLVVAFVLSMLASRLPMWFRVFSVFPSLAGVLAGAGVILTLMCLRK